MSYNNSRHLSLIDQLNRDISRAFGLPKGVVAGADHWQPRVDIIEEPTRFLLLIDVPGVDPQNIEVTAESDVLSVSGRREAAGQPTEQVLRVRECLHGDFRRSFRLPDDADANGISATGRHGVLEILIPKKAEVQPRQIPVTH